MLNIYSVQSSTICQLFWLCLVSGVWCQLSFASFSICVCGCLLVFFGAFCVCWWLVVTVGGWWWLWVSVGDRWWLLVAVNGCWCMLVSVGVCWCLLVSVGGCWCLLLAALWVQTDIATKLLASKTGDGKKTRRKKLGTRRQPALLGLCVQCTLYTVYWILYTVHCKLYTVHCTLYIL